MQLADEPAYIRSSKHWWTLGFVTVGVLVLLFVALVFLFKQRRKGKRQEEQLRALYNQLMSEPNGEYRDGSIDFKQPLHERVEQLPYDRRYEISKDRLIFKQVLLPPLVSFCLAQIVMSKIWCGKCWNIKNLFISLGIC